jgi:hypothetical protein
LAAHAGYIGCALAWTTGKKEEGVLGGIPLQGGKDDDFERNFAADFGVAIFPNVERATVAVGWTVHMFAGLQSIDGLLFLQAGTRGKAERGGEKKRTTVHGNKPSV